MLNRKCSASKPPTFHVLTLVKHLKKKTSEFHKEQEKIKPVIILKIKKIYVKAFNIYAWYWLFREIFIRNSTEF